MRSKEMKWGRPSLGWLTGFREELIPGHYLEISCNGRNVFSPSASSCLPAVLSPARLLFWKDLYPFLELETSACIFVQKPLSGFVKFRELPVTPANVGPELYLWHWWPSHYARQVEILGGCIRLCFGEVLLSRFSSLLCWWHPVKPQDVTDLA